MPLYYPQAWAVLSVVFEFSDEDRPEIIVVPARRMTIHLNDYRSADTWSLDLPARVLPFDPDIVRSLAAELYLFDAGEVTAEVDRFLIPGNLEVTGLAKDIDLDKSSGTLTITGDDYTSLVIAKEWDPPKKVIPIGQPLDRTVQTLIDEAVNADHHGGSTLRVVFQGDDQMPSAPIVGQGHTKAHKRGIPVPAGANYWDAIYQLCARHGTICYVRGNDVVISAPATLTDDTRDRSRRVAYGRNLSDFGVKRDIGHRPAPAIVATSWDPVRREKIEATWPADSRITKQVPASKKGHKRGHGQGQKEPKALKPRAFSGKHKPLMHGTGHAKDEIRRVLAPAGITSKDQLQAWARAYHAQISRAESQVHFSTHALADLDGKSLLSLRTGSAVFIEWDEFRGDELRQLDEGQRRERLIALGHPEEIAAIVARNLEAAKAFTRPFYCHAVTKEFDGGGADGGLTITVDAVNYVDPSRHGDAHVDAREIIDQTVEPVRKALDGNATLRDLLAKPAVSG